MVCIENASAASTVDYNDLILLNIGFTGHIELLDSSDKLPGLVRTPGMKTWKFQDKNSVW